MSINGWLILRALLQAVVKVMIHYYRNIIIMVLLPMTDTMSKVAKKTILLSLQLLGELLVTKSNEIPQETEIQVILLLDV